MSRQSNSPRTDPSVKALTELVHIALDQHQLSGITETLRALAVELHAFGCVLWEAKPGYDLDLTNPSGELFALAQWFEEGAAWHQDDIPIGRSATGRALTQRLRFYSTPDAQADALTFKAPFVIQNDIRAALVVPVEFLDGMPGAVDVFRRGPGRPFSTREASLLIEFARMLPKLFQTIRDEVGYSLSQAVNVKLQSQSMTQAGGPDIDTPLRRLMTELAVLVSHHLQCLDVSIFLENPIQAGGEVRSYGTTLTCEQYISSERHSVGDKQPTAYPLTHERSIRLFDLARFQPSEAETQKSYPGIAGPDEQYVECIRQLFRKSLGVGPRRPLPPMSLMAAPILARGRPLGVIRCCLPLSGPSYFADREVRTLELLAGQIGQYVSDQYSRAESERENDAWRVLVRSLSSIVSLVYGELKKLEPDAGRIFDESLLRIGELFPNAAFMDIRTLETSTGYLLPRRARGWEKAPPARAARFPVAWSHRSGRVEAKVIDQSMLAAPGATEYVATLPCRPDNLLVAPIEGHGTSGILEIGHVGLPGLPKHAVSIARILAEQIGLYHTLALTIRDLNQTSMKLKEETRQKEAYGAVLTQTFMDLKHQIKTPIRQARRRVQLALNTAQNLQDKRFEKQLLYARGILRRAMRVATSIGVFADVESGQQIRLKKKRVAYAELRKGLVEAAMDNRLLVPEWRAITFLVDDTSFEALSADGVAELDLDLLDQAVNNLLDNAGKYSYEESMVLISIREEKKRARFYVSVQNRGLRLEAGEIEKAKIRGWRSDLACGVTGEGSGIGLWIVDHIMKAHHGDLIIIPTNAEGITEIRLSFPIMKG